MGRNARNKGNIRLAPQGSSAWLTASLRDEDDVHEEHLHPPLSEHFYQLGDIGSGIRHHAMVMSDTLLEIIDHQGGFLVKGELTMTN